MLFGLEYDESMGLFKDVLFITDLKEYVLKVASR